MNSAKRLHHNLRNPYLANAVWKDQIPPLSGGESVSEYATSEMLVAALASADWWRRID
jgi:hypothetical protein